MTSLSRSTSVSIDPIQLSRAASLAVPPPILAQIVDFILNSPSPIARDGEQHVISLCTTYIAAGNDINLQFEQLLQNRTLLHFCAHHNYFWACRFLIENRADIDTLSISRNESVLTQICRENELASDSCLSFLKFLLAHDAIIAPLTLVYLLGVNSLTAVQVDLALEMLPKVSIPEEYLYQVFALFVNRIMYLPQNPYIGGVYAQLEKILIETSSFGSIIPQVLLLNMYLTSMLTYPQIQAKIMDLLGQLRSILPWTDKIYKQEPHITKATTTTDCSPSGTAPNQKLLCYSSDLVNAKPQIRDNDYIYILATFPQHNPIYRCLQFHFPITTSSITIITQLAHLNVPILYQHSYVEHILSFALNQSNYFAYTQNLDPNFRLHFHFSPAYSPPEIPTWYKLNPAQQPDKDDLIIPTPISFELCPQRALLHQFRISMSKIPPLTLSNFELLSITPTLADSQRFRSQVRYVDEARLKEIEAHVDEQAIFLKDPVKSPYFGQKLPPPDDKIPTIPDQVELYLQLFKSWQEEQEKNAGTLNKEIQASIENARSTIPNATGQQQQQPPSTPHNPSGRFSPYDGSSSMRPSSPAGSTTSTTGTGTGTETGGMNIPPATPTAGPKKRGFFGKLGAIFKKDKNEGIHNGDLFANWVPEPEDIQRYLGRLQSKDFNTHKDLYSELISDSPEEWKAHMGKIKTWGKAQTLYEKDLTSEVVQENTKAANVLYDIPTNFTMDMIHGLYHQALVLKSHFESNSKQRNEVLARWQEARQYDCTFDAPTLISLIELLISFSGIDHNSTGSLCPITNVHLDIETLTYYALELNKIGYFFDLPLQEILATLINNLSFSLDTIIYRIIFGIEPLLSSPIPDTATPQSAEKGEQIRRKAVKDLFALATAIPKLFQRLVPQLHYQDLTIHPLVTNPESRIYPSRAPAKGYGEYDFSSPMYNKLPFFLTTSYNTNINMYIVMLMYHYTFVDHQKASMGVSSLFNINNKKLSPHMLFQNNPTSITHLLRAQVMMLLTVEQPESYAASVSLLLHHVFSTAPLNIPGLDEYLYLLQSLSSLHESNSQQIPMDQDTFQAMSYLTVAVLTVYARRNIVHHNELWSIGSLYILNQYLVVLEGWLVGSNLNLQQQIASSAPGGRASIHKINNINFNTFSLPSSPNLGLSTTSNNTQTLTSSPLTPAKSGSFHPVPDGGLSRSHAKSYTQPQLTSTLSDFNSISLNSVPDLTLNPSAQQQTNTQQPNLFYSPVIILSYLTSLLTTEEVLKNTIRAPNSGPEWDKQKIELYIAKIKKRLNRVKNHIFVKRGIYSPEPISMLGASTSLFGAPVLAPSPSSSHINPPLSPLNLDRLDRLQLPDRNDSSRDSNSTNNTKGSPLFTCATNIGADVTLQIHPLSSSQNTIPLYLGECLFGQLRYDEELRSSLDYRTFNPYTIPLLTSLYDDPLVQNKIIVPTILLIHQHVPHLAFLYMLMCYDTYKNRELDKTDVENFERLISLVKKDNASQTHSIAPTYLHNNIMRYTVGDEILSPPVGPGAVDNKKKGSKTPNKNAEKLYEKSYFHRLLSSHPNVNTETILKMVIDSGLVNINQTTVVDTQRFAKNSANASASISQMAQIPTLDLYLEDFMWGFPSQSHQSFYFVHLAKLRDQVDRFTARLDWGPLTLPPGASPVSNPNVNPTSQLAALSAASFWSIKPLLTPEQSKDKSRDNRSEHPYIQNPSHFIQQYDGAYVFYQDNKYTVHNSYGQTRDFIDQYTALGIFPSSAATFMFYDPLHDYCVSIIKSELHFNSSHRNILSQLLAAGDKFLFSYLRNTLPKLAINANGVPQFITPYNMYHEPHIFLINQALAFLLYQLKVPYNQHSVDFVHLLLKSANYASFSTFISFLLSPHQQHSRYYYQILLLIIRYMARTPTKSLQVSLQTSLSSTPLLDILSHTYSTNFLHRQGEVSKFLIAHSGNSKLVDSTIATLPRTPAPKMRYHPNLVYQLLALGLPFLSIESFDFDFIRRQYKSSPMTSLNDANNKECYGIFRDQIINLQSSDLTDSLSLPHLSVNIGSSSAHNSRESSADEHNISVTRPRLSVAQQQHLHRQSTIMSRHGSLHNDPNSVSRTNDPHSVSRTALDGTIASSHNSNSSLSKWQNFFHSEIIDAVTHFVDLNMISHKPVSTISTSGSLSDHNGFEQDSTSFEGRKLSESSSSAPGSMSMSFSLPLPQIDDSVSTPLKSRKMTNIQQFMKDSQNEDNDLSYSDKILRAIYFYTVKHHFPIPIGTAEDVTQGSIQEDQEDRRSTVSVANPSPPLTPKVQILCQLCAQPHPAADKCNSTSRSKMAFLGEQAKKEKNMHIVSPLSPNLTHPSVLVALLNHPSKDFITSFIPQHVLDVLTFGQDQVLKRLKKWEQFSPTTQFSEVLRPAFDPSLQPAHLPPSVDIANNLLVSPEEESLEDDFLGQPRIHLPSPNHHHHCDQNSSQVSEYLREPMDLKTKVLVETVLNSLPPVITWYKQPTHTVAYNLLSSELCESSALGLERITIQDFLDHCLVAYNQNYAAFVTSPQFALHNKSVADTIAGGDPTKPIGSLLRQSDFTGPLTAIESRWDLMDTAFLTQVQCLGSITGLCCHEKCIQHLKNIQLMRKPLQPLQQRGGPRLMKSSDKEKKKIVLSAGATVPQARPGVTSEAKQLAALSTELQPPIQPVLYEEAIEMVSAHTSPSLLLYILSHVSLPDPRDIHYLLNIASQRQTDKSQSTFNTPKSTTTSSPTSTSQFKINVLTPQHLFTHQTILMLAMLRRWPEDLLTSLYKVMIYQASGGPSSPNGDGSSPLVSPLAMPGLFSGLAGVLSAPPSAQSLTTIFSATDVAKDGLAEYAINAHISYYAPDFVSRLLKDSRKAASLLSKTNVNNTVRK